MQRIGAISSPNAASESTEIAASAPTWKSMSASVTGARGKVSESFIACLPGALRGAPGGEGVIGVAVHAECPRHALQLPSDTLGTTLAASPYPRPVPGVPPERNLSGVSFAEANVTGLLARFLERRAHSTSAADLIEEIRRAMGASGGDEPGFAE